MTSHVKVTESIKPLTTIRFMAAFYVVLYHTLPVVAPGLGKGLIQFGYCSVSFFFILSGFVLAVAYLERPGKLERGKFWIARFARIYPLYSLSFCLDLFSLMAMRIAKYGVRVALLKTTVTFAATLLMLKAWAPKYFGGLDDPNWSLSVEAFFYFLFPMVARWLWERSLRSAATLLLSFYIAGVALVILAMRLHLEEGALLYEPLLHTAAFLEGILLAKFYVRWRADIRVWTRLQSWSFPAALVAVSVPCVLMRYPSLIAKPILHDGGLFPVFAALILVFSCGAVWVERLFSSRLLVILGESSFGLYLLHVVMWHYTYGLILHRANLGAYFIYLVATVALSIVSFLFFETPARAYILRKSKLRSRENLLLSSLAE